MAAESAAAATNLAAAAAADLRATTRARNDDTADAVRRLIESKSMLSIKEKILMKFSESRQLAKPPQLPMTIHLFLQFQ